MQRASRPAAIWASLLLVLSSTPPVAQAQPPGDGPAADCVDGAEAWTGNLVRAEESFDLTARFETDRFVVAMGLPPEWSTGFTGTNFLELVGPDVYLNVALLDAPVDPDDPMSETPVAIGPCGSDFIDWIEEHPYLESSGRAPVKVGDTSGERIDVVVAVPEGYRSSCGLGCISLFRTTPQMIGADFITMDDLEQDRFIALDTGSGVALVNIWVPAANPATAGSQERFVAGLEAAGWVLDTMRFEAIVAVPPNSDAPALDSEGRCPALADGTIVACPDTGVADVFGDRIRGVRIDPFASEQFYTEARIAPASSIGTTDGSFTLRFAAEDGTILAISGVATTGTFEDDERFRLRLDRPYFARGVINTFSDDGSRCSYDITRATLGVVEGSYRCVDLPQLGGEGWLDLNGSFGASASIGSADAATTDGQTFFEAPLRSVSEEFPGGPMSLTYVDEQFDSLEIVGFFTRTGTFGQEDGFSVRLYVPALGRYIIDSSAGDCPVTVMRVDSGHIEGVYGCDAVTDEGVPPINGSFDAIPIGSRVENVVYGSEPLE